ncbi:MAG TPA: ATPase domain-containing protein [Polyangiales bacterium]|nr:ATPase domain-containing protein [Polyangiales bacterium]
MNTTASARPLVPTGISGLDTVLMGGFLAGGFYLFQGDPGSGKTTLALQFVQSRLLANERCLYVSLTESRRDLEETCRSHNWSIDELELLDLTRTGSVEAGGQVSIFHPADTELSDIIKTVVAAVERVQPQHVVFDGLAELRLLSGDPLRYRRQLLSLKDFFAARTTTVVLLDDRSASFSEFQPESLMGANVVLERLLPSYGRARRRLFVTKVRGAQFREGYHDYEIVTGGLVLHPRLVAGEHRGSVSAELCGSGIENLDLMLRGGLSSGSTTLLVGPAGSGKSTISMQFVINAMRRGKKAAVYLFDEVMHTLTERSEKLCLGTPGGFSRFVEDGVLHAQQVDPAELSPGAFAHEVRRAVEAGASVIVIDSLNGYLSAMPEERFLETHLHELFAYLNQKGVLTIFVVAQQGMMIGTNANAGLDVSYLADTVLLFRYYEHRGSIKQALSVFKKRTGPHERTIRQLVIDQTGVHVGPPLEELQGIMTGVPQYAGSAELGRAQRSNGPGPG